MRRVSVPPGEGESASVTPLRVVVRRGDECQPLGLLCVRTSVPFFFLFLLSSSSFDGPRLYVDTKRWCKCACVLRRP